MSITTLKLLLIVLAVISPLLVGLITFSLARLAGKPWPIACLIAGAALIAWSTMLATLEVDLG